jgi:hypothetical protein
VVIAGTGVGVGVGVGFGVGIDVGDGVSVGVGFCTVSVDMISGPLGDVVVCISIGSNGVAVAIKVSTVSLIVSNDVGSVASRATRSLV